MSNNQRTRAVIRAFADLATERTVDLCGGHISIAVEHLLKRRLGPLDVLEECPRRNVASLPTP